MKVNEKKDKWMDMENFLKLTNKYIKEILDQIKSMAMVIQ